MKLLEMERICHSIQIVSLTDIDVTPERSGHVITPAQQRHGCRCIGFGMYLCTIAYKIFKPESSAKKRSELTSNISLGDMRPVCHTLVMLVNAGMQENTRVPPEIFDSSSVGSSQISSPTAA